MKKLLALGLTLVLTLSAVPALAVDAHPFPATKPYPGFADVKAEAWYGENVKTCVETGLMVGTDKGFSPDAPMQVAEVATIAARMNAAITGNQVPMPTPKAGETLPWYEGYTTYLKALATAAKNTALVARLTAPEERATRRDFISMLALVVPEGQLPAINNVASLPDTGDAAVLKFYNAGILQGVGTYGLFEGSKGLTRAEASAMIARTVRPEQRLHFTLKESGSLSVATLGLDPDTVVCSMGSRTLLLEEYVQELATQLDVLAAVAAQKGLSLGKDLMVGDLPVTTFWTQKTKSELFARYAMEDYAAAHNFTYQAPVKDGTTDRSNFFDKGIADLQRPDNPALDEYMAAKHILIKDKTKAETVLATLKKDPKQFDALMNQHSEDGRDADGNLGAPLGYVFKAGQMVPEFEAGVKALKIGEISPLVQSQYGYHIILRMDHRNSDSAGKFLADAYGTIIQNYGIISLTPDLEDFYARLLVWRAAQK